MTVATVEMIMKRISEATPRSPIAVFVTFQPKPRISTARGTVVKPVLDAVFGNTVYAYNQINSKREAPKYIGSFHKEMDRRKVKSKLMYVAETQQMLQFARGD